MSLTRRLAGEGRAVVAVVHDLNLAARHADRMALLKDGTLAATGAAGDVLTEATVSEVFDHPDRVLAHPDSDRPLLVAAAPD